MKENDEYKWENYHQEYMDQLKELREKDGLDFFVTKVTEKRSIDFHDNLHPNWKELYSTIYQLNPKSVFEVGCGGCYHIKNIMSIFPWLETRIGGMDLLEEQLKLGIDFCRLPKSVSQNLYTGDFTTEESYLEIPQGYELVYSQAVIMHLSTEKAILALRNMGRLSYKYIILIEGTANHENWYELVQQTLPDWDFKIINNYIDNGILLTRKKELSAGDASYPNIA